MEYANLAVKSGLLQGCRVEHIPNGIDVNTFRTLPKAVAREVLGIPNDRKVVLFGAVGGTADYRKGFDLLARALGLLDADSSLHALVFGADDSHLTLSCGTTFLGRLHDSISIGVAYSAADIFVCPSRQENFPNTILEALACGTPVAAFDVGGNRDMIETGVTGYLAEPGNADDLARGIMTLLNDVDACCKMGENGRIKVMRTYALPVIARRYAGLYEDILAGTMQVRK